MRPRRYPLEPLAELRRARSDAAVRELAAAVGARERAARAHLAARSRRDEHDRATAAARAAERETLARGELRAGDLARTDAWAARREGERQALTAGIDRAGAAEAAAAEREGRAAGDAASRRADAQVVERHRARWDRSLRARDEAGEEEASAEAWRPGR